MSCFTVYQLTGPTLRARIETPTGTAILQSDVDSIRYAVVDHFNSDGITDSGTLDPTDVINNTLQPWDRDQTGYNFSWPVPPAALPLADRRYEVEVVTVLTDLSEHVNVWQLNTVHRPNQA